jgi:pyruvate carboxylase
MRATPEFDFGLSEQTMMLRETVARFADDRIAPIAAMKMEQAIKSPLDGIVSELPVVRGQQVGAEALLIRVEKEPV